MEVSRFGVEVGSGCVDMMALGDLLVLSGKNGKKEEAYIYIYRISLQAQAVQCIQTLGAYIPASRPDGLLKVSAQPPDGYGILAVMVNFGEFARGIEVFNLTENGVVGQAGGIEGNIHGAGAP